MQIRYKVLQLTNSIMHNHNSVIQTSFVLHFSIDFGSYKSNNHNAIYSKLQKIKVARISYGQ